MTELEKVAWTIGAMVVGSILPKVIKKLFAWARVGQQAEEHSQFVTKDECGGCQKNHDDKITDGNELFLLLLDGQALSTQVMIHLCEGDPSCRELLAILQQHLNKLVTRKLKRQGYAG